MDKTWKRVAATVLFVPVALCVLPPRAAAQWPPIAVTVTETEGVGREQWPLTFSVPFPRGLVKDESGLVVTEESGAALPVQTRILRRWEDGSVRWLLVDTQVSVKAGDKRRLQVKAGKRPPAAATLQVEENEERIAVDTGAIRFEIPRRRFAIIDSLRPAGPEPAVAAGPLDSYLVANEKAARAGPPDSAIVVEKGPLRVRVVLRGSYGNGFDYVVRVEAYAGQPLVRVLYTFINRSGAAYTDVQRVTVETALRGSESGAYAFGRHRASPVRGALAGDERLHLYQVDNLTYEVGGARGEGRLAGWLEFCGKQTCAGLAARWLWQEYPKSIELRPGRLTYNLWAPEAPATRAGVGAAKTHEFVFWAAPPGVVGAALAPGIARTLLAAVDPHWVARSGALPDAVAPPALGFVRKLVEAAARYRHRTDRERWNDCGRVRCQGAKMRARVGAYGMWNWGDWNFAGFEDDVKGTDAWGNLEYDTAQVLALGFAASGEPELREAMVAAARHFMDVDTIHHYPPRPQWVGMNHPKNPLHFTFELGGIDLGHTWTQGLVSHFYLTGERRALDAARGIADYLRKRIEGSVRGNPRQWGWPQIALLAVYDATGGGEYLTAAREYARRGMAAHPPTDVGKWKLGILAEALSYTHAATGDAHIEQWLREYARQVMGRKVRQDARLYPAVAYVAALTGDPAMRTAALERAGQLNLGSWGKPFTINGRVALRIYSLLSSPASPPR